VTVTDETRPVTPPTDAVGLVMVISTTCFSSFASLIDAVSVALLALGS
jgi:hypothetical protein